MRLPDTRNAYGVVSISLHWIVALSVFFLMYTGQLLEWADEGEQRGGGDAAREGARAAGRAAGGAIPGGFNPANFTDAIFSTRGLHISIGILATVFIVGRIVWRLTQGSLDKGNEAPALNLLAQLVQWGLLLALLVLVVSGPLENWVVGRPVDVFNWFQIASPIARNFQLRGIVETSHAIAAKAMYALVALHVLGALKHLIVDRDNVFRRIFVPAQSKTQREAPAE